MLIRAALVMFAVSWTGYWIAGLAVAVLFLIWALLSTAEGPPVLALALTYQWMQVTIGLFYSTLTGEELEAMYQTDWQRMGAAAARLVNTQFDAAALQRRVCAALELGHI